MIFGLKRCGHKATEKRKAKNHKLPLSRHFLKFKMPLLVKFSHKLSPLFNRFSTFDKNVNLSKANPEAENFLLVFPSPNTSIFTTYLKITSTLRPFRKAWLKSQFSKWKSFQTFSMTMNKSFLPNNSREKDNLIKNLFKSFKDTISKTKTCFRQHHDFSKETFQRKGFRNSD